MKKLILAVGFYLFAIGAQAGSYETYSTGGNIDYNTDGSMVQHIGNTNFRTDAQGNTSNYESYGSGNIKYNTDGSIETKVGGTIYRDESSSSRYGYSR